MQQSGRHSVNIFWDKQLRLFPHSISEGLFLKNFLQSESSYIIKAVITANKFNLRCVILKNFQQSERFIAIECKLAEITLKFDLRVPNLEKFQLSEGI